MGLLPSRAAGSVASAVPRSSPPAQVSGDRSGEGGVESFHCPSPIALALL
jgi:hypothetical protein